MGYELKIDELYEPQASTYQGEAETLTAEFWGPPEFFGLENIINSGLEVVAAAQGLEPLRLRVWVDPADWYNSKIKVVATAYEKSGISSFPAPDGEVQRVAWPVAIWLAIVAGLAAITGLVLISYFVSKTDWGKAGLPVGLIGLAVIGIIGAILYTRRK